MVDAPQIMGILNVTPDSFSGDGLMQERDFAAATLTQAESMIKDGATWLDVGGESTRPDASEVSLEDEMHRVIPVIQAVHKAFPDIKISVDTRRLAIAKEAIKTGASMINDVSGVDADPAMATLAAETRSDFVIMHNMARADRVKKDAVIGGEYEAPDYSDLIKDVTAQLSDMADAAIKAGIAREKIFLDPGLGFGKTPKQNLKLIKEIDAIKALGYPVLLAASRKSFIGHVLESVPEDRLEGMAAIAALSCDKQVDILRVHDVRFIARTVKMVCAVLGA